MVKIQERKGITLIALIITIIVLLIMAGIAIGALTSNNSVLKQSREAKNNTLSGEESEKVKIAVADSVTEASVKGKGFLTTELVNKGIKGEFGEDAEVEGDGPWKYYGKYGIYNIDDGGIIETEEINKDGIKNVVVNTYNATLYIQYFSGELYKCKYTEDDKIGEGAFFRHNRSKETFVTNNVKLLGEKAYLTNNNDLYSYEGTKIASNVKKFDRTYYLTTNNELYLVNGNTKIDDDVISYTEDYYLKSDNGLYDFYSKNKFLDLVGEVKTINMPYYLTYDGVLYCYDEFTLEIKKMAEGVKELFRSYYLNTNNELVSLLDKSIISNNVKKASNSLYLKYNNELYMSAGGKLSDNVKDFYVEYILSTDDVLYVINGDNSTIERCRDVKKFGNQWVEGKDGKIYWWLEAS